MSQNPSAARPPDQPEAPRPSAGTSTVRRESSDQIWKLIAFAMAVLLLGVTLFFITREHTSQQATEEEQVTEEAQAPEEEAAEEEKEEKEEKPTPPPPPAAAAPDPRPAPRSSAPSAPEPPESQGALPAALANVKVLSVGFSPTPGRRVVALRIGGGLPYFLREGDTIGEMKILAILTDRVQVSQGGKTYDIMVAQ